MGWIGSLFFPLKKLWGRCRSPLIGKSRGIYMLYEDVKSCECEDVQALWSMVVVQQHRRRSPPPPRRRGLLRRWRRRRPATIL